MTPPVKYEIQSDAAVLLPESPRSIPSIHSTMRGSGSVSDGFALVQFTASLLFTAVSAVGLPRIGVPVLCRGGVTGSADADR